jgi:2-polyprenyl-3-methyl-5-hydroxy-6-metoxy-1,4-benzoquinol methylase
MHASHCRLCQSERLSLHFVVRESTLDRCGECGFVQVRNQPSNEELEAIYGEAYFPEAKYDNGFAQRRENQRRLALMERAGVRAGGHVLDAGCGPGDFVSFARDRYDMWGLDVSPTAIEQARGRNPEIASQLSSGFLEDQEFEPEFFDAIVLWDVVEHVWNPRSVCGRLVNWLRPGGSLILSTPDIGAATARLLRERWAFMTPPEHLGFFNRSSLTFLLERELGLRTTASTASGKWVNVGFLLYKLGRVFGPVIPQSVTERIERSPFGRTAVYVPTADIRYVAASKPPERDFH